MSGERGAPVQESGARTLIAVSHGTANKAGQQAIAQLRTEIGAALAQRPTPAGAPDATQVLEAYVDVQQPSLDEVAAANPGALIVPLLLSTGYHVKTDVARAAKQSGSIAALPLGPHPALARAMLQRAVEQKMDPGRYDTLVVASAGSSDPQTAHALSEVASQLGDLLRDQGTPRPLTCAFGASASPSVPEAISQAAASSGRVLVLSYLLAPGYFYEQVRMAVSWARHQGIQVDHTEPLLPSAEVCSVALERIGEALEGGSRQGAKRW